MIATADLEAVSNSRVAPGPIRRFTADMIDPWLIKRLGKIWPGRTEVQWQGRFLGFCQSNDYLIICNDRAVLLAERKPHPMSGVPRVDVIFCWSRDTREGDWIEVKHAQPILDLYNHCRRWMTAMDGECMLCGLCDDLRGDTIMSLWLGSRGVDGGPAIIVRPLKARVRDEDTGQWRKA